MCGRQSARIGVAATLLVTIAVSAPTAAGPVGVEENPVLVIAQVSGPTVMIAKARKEKDPNSAERGGKTRKLGANWRFGKCDPLITLKDGYFVYCALKNHGSSSYEKVFLYLLENDPDITGPGDKDKPVADLKKLTRGSKSKAKVLKLPVVVPKRLRGDKEIRLFLVVSGTVTDMIPIVDGELKPKAKVRADFQK